MASTVWKGYISFGLVSVPVRLYAAAREEHVSFNQIHEPCGSRIKQQIFCPTCERVVERSELVKGYQVDRDAYVLVNNEELKTLQAESSEAMEITQFVSLSEVDPIYFESSYYSAPEDRGPACLWIVAAGDGKAQCRRDRQGHAEPAGADRPDAPVPQWNRAAHALLCL